MKILIRNPQSPNWTPIKSAGYNAETELQELLAESPDLLAIGEIRPGVAPLVAAVREAGLPGSGYTDLLAFNPEGEIVVVECKLAANPEIKRTVIAQVLEYGAFLWTLSYDELNELVRRRAHKDLADLVGDSVEDPDWDEEAFRENVAANLARGSFILVIAVDEMNPELERTMRFLNTCGNPEFAFSVLEMRRFQSEEAEVLVPQVHGTVTTAQLQKSGSKKQWTEERFRQTIAESMDPQTRAVALDLLDWSKVHADRVWFGTGKVTGSFTFHYLKDGVTCSIFSVYTSDQLTLNYGWLSQAIDRGLLQEFHAQITAIPTLAGLPARFEGWPSIRISEAFVGDSQALEQFKRAVEALGEKIRAGQA